MIQSPEVLMRFKTGLRGIVEGRERERREEKISKVVHV
jgi:hypothetical protein